MSQARRLFLVGRADERRLVREADGRVNDQRPGASRALVVLSVPTSAGLLEELALRAVERHPAQACAAALPPPCALTNWPWFFVSGGGRDRWSITGMDTLIGCPASGSYSGNGAEERRGLAHLSVVVASIVSPLSVLPVIDGRRRRAGERAAGLLGDRPRRSLVRTVESLPDWSPTPANVLVRVTVTVSRGSRVPTGRTRAGWMIVNVAVLMVVVGDRCLAARHVRRRDRRDDGEHGDGHAGDDELTH